MALIDYNYRIIFMRRNLNEVLASQKKMLVRRGEPANSIDDEKMADSFFNLDDTPSNILPLVFDYKKRQDILLQLPHYKSLPPLAKFADTVARTYKTFGKKKAIAEIKKRLDSSKGRSLAYAFLLALDKGEDTKWQYSKQEIEYGDFLKEYTKNLLDAKPKNYNKALKNLLTASGSNERID